MLTCSILSFHICPSCLYVVIFLYVLIVHVYQVALTHGPENVKPQVKQTDDNGNFCFEVC